MKKAFLVFLLLSISILVKPQFDVSSATEAESRLIILSGSIPELLYQKEAVSLYSNFSQTYYYSERLQSANQILDDIKSIEKIFQQLSENNRSEKDYYIKLAFCDLLIVSIVANREQFLDFINITKGKNDYQAIFKEWEKMEYMSISNARKRLNSVVLIDSNNLDVKIIEAILLYYEHQVDKSLSSLIEIAKYLEKNNLKNVQGEDFEKASYLGYIYSWLSFICIQKGDSNIAKEYLASTKAINEPVENAFWARNVEKVLDGYQIYNYDIDIIPFKTPSKLMVDQKNFELYGSLFNSVAHTNDLYEGKLTFRIDEKNNSLDVRPEILVAETKKAWQSLMVIENDSWVKADLFFKESKKTASIAGDKTYIVLSYYNGFNQLNRNRHLKRFQKVFNLLDQFKAIRAGWNSLVLQNQEISYYRINRIKNNLAIYYIVNQKSNLTNIFNYYKFNGQLIDAASLSKINDAFDVSVLSDIRNDIEFLRENNPNHLESLLVIAEAAVFVEDYSAAQNILDEMLRKLKKVTDDPAYIGQIEKYRSYLHFKHKENRAAKASLETLANYEYLQDFYVDLKKKINLTENNKKY